MPCPAKTAAARFTSRVRRTRTIARVNALGVRNTAIIRKAPRLRKPFSKVTLTRELPMLAGLGGGRLEESRTDRD